MNLPPLILKKHEERRIKAGHLWVFSNEVDTAQTPLTGFAPGALAQLCEHGGRPLGMVYVNPHSLICARLLTRGTKHVPPASLLVHRLKVALSLRERLYPAPYYRLVYGESDGLPGLVVDRFGDMLVVQFTTAGMETLRGEVIAALEKVLAPQGIVLRNDSGIRELEGLSLYTDTHGRVAEEVTLEEDGLRFTVPLAGGQKTGWFYDQRENRAMLARYCRGARVLDVFSYAGAWGVRAAASGAAEVMCLDSSAQALEYARRNATDNGLSLQTLEEDAFEGLKRLREARERFDVVVIDPPAFIKRRKDHKQGLAAYHHLNQLAMQLLGRDGFLISCSCSQHLAPAELVQTLQRAGRHLDRGVQLLAQGGQGPDHPVHPAIPETAYLKALFARVVLA